MGDKNPGKIPKIYRSFVMQVSTSAGFLHPFPEIFIEAKGQETLEHTRSSHTSSLCLDIFWEVREP